MFKELKRIYKTLKAREKFGRKHDAEPLDVPTSPLSLPEETNQSETPELQNKNQYQNTPSPSTIQQDNAPLAANHFSRAAKEKNEKQTPFFKRLYSAVYLEALFLALVQMNAANAENKQPISAPDALALTNDTNTPDDVLLSPTNANWSGETSTLKSLTLKIDDFVDNQSHFGTSTQFKSEDIRLDRLLEDVVTHSNFNPIKLKELDRSKKISLQEFNQENQFDIIDEDNYILIELDDDALLFATEELAVFGGNGFNFFIMTNETLNIFENNTTHNSWESLRPGQEYFVLKKEDVLEEDIEIISVKEEISFDDNDQTTETITVDYFMYQETVIGLSFDLPPDFYEKHGDLDLAALFA
jgi:hypothetical protein